MSGIKKLVSFSNLSDSSTLHDVKRGKAFGITVESLANQSVRRKCQSLLRNLKKQCPDLFPEFPLNEGEISAPIHIDKATITTLFRLALQRDKSSKNEPIIWQLNEAQALFHPDKTKIEISDGFILVGIVLETKQTGQATLTVAFATGRNGRLSGTVMTTEERPRGPELLVNIWSDAVIAAAYDAVLQVTNGIAAEVGNDKQGQVLRAGAIVATKNGLGIIPQAYHSFENTIRDRFQPNIPISTLGKDIKPKPKPDPTKPKPKPKPKNSTRKRRKNP